VRDKVDGHIRTHFNVKLQHTMIHSDEIHLTLANGTGTSSIAVDHVIAGTGYRVALERLPFLEDRLRKRIRAVEDAPVLNRFFESSVPGLFFVGLASANSFGPLTRFAYGAMYTSRRLSRHLAARHR
jgi:hypothetical protein